MIDVLTIYYNDVMNNNMAGCSVADSEFWKEAPRLQWTSGRSGDPGGLGLKPSANPPPSAEPGSRESNSCLSDSWCCSNAALF